MQSAKGTYVCPKRLHALLCSNGGAIHILVQSRTSRKTDSKGKHLALTERNAIENALNTPYGIRLPGRSLAYHGEVRGHETVRKDKRRAKEHMTSRYIYNIYVVMRGKHFYIEATIHTEHVRTVLFRSKELDHGKMWHFELLHHTKCK